MRVGVLTGGGDCPGLNAVIRSVVRKGVGEYAFDFVGLRDGWLGLPEDHVVPLDIAGVRAPAAAPSAPRRAAGAGARGRTPGRRAAIRVGFGGRGNSGLVFRHFRTTGEVSR